MRKLLTRLAIAMLPAELMVVEREPLEHARTHAIQLSRSANGSGHLLSRAYSIGRTIRMQTTDLMACVVRSVNNVQYYR